MSLFRVLLLVCVLSLCVLTLADHAFTEDDSSYEPVQLLEVNSAHADSESGWSIVDSFADADESHSEDEAVVVEAADADADEAEQEHDLFVEVDTEQDAQAEADVETEAEDEPSVVPRPSKSKKGKKAKGKGKCTGKKATRKCTPAKGKKAKSNKTKKAKSAKAKAPKANPTVVPRPPKKPKQNKQPKQPKQPKQAKPAKKTKQPKQILAGKPDTGANNKKNKQQEKKDKKAKMDVNKVKNAINNNKANKNGTAVVKNNKNNNNKNATALLNNKNKPANATQLNKQPIPAPPAAGFKPKPTPIPRPVPRPVPRPASRPSAPARRSGGGGGGGVARRGGGGGGGGGHSSGGGGNVPTPEFHGNLNLPKGDGKHCLSLEGIKLIKEFEGFRANFYKDAVGIKTIGYGTACHAYPCQTLHPPLTEAKATEVMYQDVMNRFYPCVKKKVHKELTPNQFSALLAFTYNLGCGGMKANMAAAVNAGNGQEVGNIMMRYTKAGGKTLRGLVRRRSAEAKLFNSNEPGTCYEPGKTQ